MNTEFMDKCFQARMNCKRRRFPLQEFKQKFIELFAQDGLVIIQTNTIPNMCAGVMDAGSGFGFVFDCQHNRDIALRLLRKWGFKIVLRREYDGSQELSAYAVQLPDEYLSRKISSDKRGEIRTGLRSTEYIDKTKVRKRYDWTL